MVSRDTGLFTETIKQSKEREREMNIEQADFREYSQSGFQHGTIDSNLKKTIDNYSEAKINAEKQNQLQNDKQSSSQLLGD